MVVYKKVSLQHLLKVDFVRFCVVGGLGFFINLFILTILVRLHVPLLVAQLIGAEIALGVNFSLHHHWTYKSKKVNKSIRKLLWQFHATSWPAIVGSSLMVFAGVHYFNLEKIVSLTVSSVVALIWNFSWSKFVVWKAVTTDQIEEIADA